MADGWMQGSINSSRVGGGEAALSSGIWVAPFFSIFDFSFFFFFDSTCPMQPHAPVKAAIKASRRENELYVYLYLFHSDKSGRVRIGRSSNIPVPCFPQPTYFENVLMREVA